MSQFEDGKRNAVCEEQQFEWNVEDDLPPEEDAAYYDDLSGKRLPEELVQEARYEEIKFIDKIKLWNVVPRPSDGSKVIDTRWVDVNKGDENEPLVRARLVAKEIKKKGTLEAYFAAMPPLLALKLLLSLACTTNLPVREQTYSKRGRYCIQFIDVKKAHFWAKAERTLRGTTQRVQAISWYLWRCSRGSK